MSVGSTRPSLAAPDQPSYNLGQLLQLTREHNPLLAAARQQLLGAQAGTVSARALPNPELELLTGRQRARVPGVPEGSARSLTLSQRLDLPPQRRARIAAAEAAVQAEQAQLQLIERDVAEGVRLRYFELLRRQNELEATNDDYLNSLQIQERVSLRVQSGESPRYDAIKADAELLNAQKLVQSARLRVDLARAALRSAVGRVLPERFEVEMAYVLPDPVPLETMQATLLSTHPLVLRGRAEVERARQQLALERSNRLPAVALRAGYDQDPEVRSARAGIALSIPLVDRRAGPIAEAGAQLARLQAEQEQREFALRQALENAWRQYEISRTQVAALESGIVRQAQAALRVAEAAYRFGERGILDYLDAQRVYRNARNELIAARHDLRVAWIELLSLQGE